jgi:hypothetical protein
VATDFSWLTFGLNAVYFSKSFASESSAWAPHRRDVHCASGPISRERYT